MPNTLSPEFFDWLDEQPRTPTGVLVIEGGETRVRPISYAFAEWRSRHPQPARTASPHPDVERRRNQLAIFADLIEKEAR